MHLVSFISPTSFKIIKETLLKEKLQIVMLARKSLVGFFVMCNRVPVCKSF